MASRKARIREIKSLRDHRERGRTAAQWLDENTTAREREMMRTGEWARLTPDAQQARYTRDQLAPTETADEYGARDGGR